MLDNKPLLGNRRKGKKAEDEHEEVENIVLLAWFDAECMMWVKCKEKLKWQY